MTQEGEDLRALARSTCATLGVLNTCCVPHVYSATPVAFGLRKGCVTAYLPNAGCGFVPEGCARLPGPSLSFCAIRPCAEGRQVWGRGGWGWDSREGGQATSESSQVSGQSAAHLAHEIAAIPSSSEHFEFASSWHSDPDFVLCGTNRATTTRQNSACVVRVQDQSNMCKKTNDTRLHNCRGCHTSVGMARSWYNHYHWHQLPSDPKMHNTPQRA